MRRSKGNKYQKYQLTKKWQRMSYDERLAEEKRREAIRKSRMESLIFAAKHFERDPRVEDRSVFIIARAGKAKPLYLYIPA